MPFPKFPGPIPPVFPSHLSSMRPSHYPRKKRGGENRFGLADPRKVKLDILRPKFSHKSLPPGERGGDHALSRNGER